jgi:TolB protein
MHLSVRSYDPSVNPSNRSSPPRRAAPKRAAASATVAGLALVGLLAGCSKDSDAGAEGGKGKATTTTAAAATTTSPVPLDPAAADHQLAYLSTDDSGTTVFLTDGKGAETEVLAKVAGRAEALTWSPDGSKLLLDGDASGDFELQVIDATDGEVSVLAPSASSSEGGASWSPDGTRVAFFSDLEGGFAGYVVPVAGGAPVRITPPEATGVADLAWSPDGEQLAFSTSSDVDSDVWVVAADGSDPRKVSKEAGSSQPRWSPDGTLLAISAQPLGSETAAIFTMDPETGEADEVADTEYRDAFPVWAPDGRSLYFVSAVPSDEADGGAADDVFRVDLAGGDPEPVIADGISIESELVATADGKLIAFSVERLKDKEVFVANADGTGAIPVSRSDRLDAWAAWRPGTGPARE